MNTTWKRKRTKHKPKPASPFYRWFDSINKWRGKPWKRKPLTLAMVNDFLKVFMEINPTSDEMTLIVDQKTVEKIKSIEP